MNRSKAAALATAAVGAAQLIGALHGPTSSHPDTARWYAGLRKPGFTPPGPVFGVVWTALDALLGYAGYRLLSATPSPARSTALSVWGANLLGIAGYTWVMFGGRRLGAATAVTTGMLATSAGAVAAAARVDRRAAEAIVPLACWIVFATLLQEETWRRNR